MQQILVDRERDLELEIGKLKDNMIVWILSVESQRIRILISIFERLVEVREQEIYEPGVSAEKVIGG